MREFIERVAALAPDAIVLTIAADQEVVAQQRTSRLICRRSIDAERLRRIG